MLYWSLSHKPEFFMTESCFCHIQLMKPYQMKQEEENMINLVTPLHSSLRSLKADIGRVLTNLTTLTLMTYSRILTSTAKTGMPVTEDILMNTPGLTRRLTAGIRDTFKEALEQVSLMTCLMT